MPSDVFPPDSKPQTVDKETLLVLIDDLRMCVERDDSMEGCLMYGWSDTPGKYDIGGMYRVGNSLGQGGARLLWETP